MLEDLRHCSKLADVQIHKIRLSTQENSVREKLVFTTVEKGYKKLDVGSKAVGINKPTLSHCQSAKNNEGRNEGRIRKAIG
jgi:hypothetical protein